MIKQTKELFTIIYHFLGNFYLIITFKKKYFSVQFHPEHSAGPTDMECLFDVFIDIMAKTKIGVDFRFIQ